MLKVLIFLLLLQSIDCKNNFYGTFFTVFSSNNSSEKGQLWNENQNLTSLNCSTDENLTFIVHGFRASKGEWQWRLKDQFLKHRDGCVIIYNWGKLSDFNNYYKVAKRTWPIAVAIMLGRIENITTVEEFSPDKILLYGHSLGARMVIEVGLRLGAGMISQIDGNT